jgi:MFS family permease
VVGPAIAVMLLQQHNGNYQTVFWLATIPGLLAVFTIFICIKEENKATSTAAKRPKLSLEHFGWQMKFFVVITAIFALGNSSDAFLILRAEQSGIAPLMIPLVYLTFNLIYAFSAIPAGIIADRFGKKPLIFLGFLLFAVLYSGFAIAGSPTEIWVLFSCYGVFMGLTEGIQKGYLATIIPPDFKATAFGVHATAVGLATLPASLIAGLLWDRVSPAATFYFGAATATVAALLFLILILLDKRQTTSEAVLTSQDSP